MKTPTDSLRSALQSHLDDVREPGNRVSASKLVDVALDALAKDGFVIVEIGSEAVARRHRRAISLLHRVEEEEEGEQSASNVKRLPGH
jgi:hypothetical protein